MEDMRSKINEIIDGKHINVVKKIFEECINSYNKPFVKATFKIEKTYYPEDDVFSREEAKEQFITDISENLFSIEEVEDEEIG